MANKIYTAQEMRDVAQCLHYNSPTKLTVEAAAMLRQSADAMDREEKCEKKYEYALELLDGSVLHLHYNDKSAIKIIMSCETIVRREVGEWEEVRDGE